MTDSARSGPLRDPGAEERLRALVFEFYDRVRGDDLLGPVFEDRIGGRWEEHLERMCDFWSSVLHASGRYRGDPVGSHARIHDIAPRHFDRWIDLFEETAHEVLPVEEAEDIVGRSRRMRVVLERSIRYRSGARAPADETPGAGERPASENPDASDSPVMREEHR